MLKGHYLKIVNPFVEWMSQHLDDSTFRHSYVNRRNGRTITFKSLFNAYEKFDWPHPGIARLGVAPGRDFPSSTRALTALQSDLAANISSPSDAKACQAAIDVMRWGGVTSGNVRWLRAHTAGLASLLDTTRLAFNAGDTSHPVLMAPSLRFNAGMTKVYSLICDDFIIYDSRVAAALGWAVAKYAATAHVSKELLFPWLPAKESPTAKNPKNRDPSAGTPVFPDLRKPVQHAEWNLKASWLLEAVIKHAHATSSGFNTITDAAAPSRRLEAALFMIGYDLPLSHSSAGATSPPAALQGPGTPQPTPPTNWIDCWTLAHTKPFSYRFTSNGLETRDGPRFSDGVVDGTLGWLWNQFGSNPFPLQNSATAVRNGTASQGLGTGYFAQGGNPPDTSKLAAILEDMSVLLPDASVAARGMHWRLNTTLLRPAGSTATVSIRQIIDDLVSRESET